MDHEGPDRQPEVLLDQWLREKDAERSRQQLEILLDRHAAPLIRKIVGFKLGSPHADAEDVSQNALYQLLARLERLRNGDGSAGFRDFTAYAAVTAYNACNAYFRARKPAWLSLSMKVRYAATHAPKLGLWEGPEGRDVCGFSANRGRTPITSPDTVARACTSLKGRFDASRLPIPELIQHLLKAAGGPLILETLVDAAAELAGLQEETVYSLDQAAAPLPSKDPAADLQLIHRNYVRLVWKEITALPLEHRRALLLNLNDSAGGDIRLFDSLGIASIRQIAAAVEMDALEFAGLWKDLPLDDIRLAQLLGISRQDVVNRRSTARKRLVRRLHEMEGR